MSAILIKSNKTSIKKLVELANRMGSEVFDIDDEMVQDLLLGKLMDEVKTGETIPKSKIINTLNGK